MTQMRDDIRRTIVIHAPLETVWELVSEPGWWINDGALGGHRTEWDGSTCLVHDATLGTFPVGIEVLDAPHRAVFTWLAGEREEAGADRGAEDGADGGVDSGVDGGAGTGSGPACALPSTRIEFVLVQEQPGAVRLTVTESGFAAMTREQHERNYGDNASGWELEIGRARDALEGKGPQEADDA